MYKLDASKPFKILSQPTDESCGPTCLKAVYDYFDDTVNLSILIEEIRQVKGGGTLAVMLGNHALKKGYMAEIYSNNLQVFDPTWFQKGVDVTLKLKEQAEFKKSSKLRVATRQYVKFLTKGGKIHFREFNSGLLKKILQQGIPILTGLSATYLYQCAREIPENNTYHDTKGVPVGHFVVICGYNPETKMVKVADPLTPNPLQADSRIYEVGIRRLINSILLGIVTYDANLLIVYPKNYA